MVIALAMACSLSSSAPSDPPATLNQRSATEPPLALDGAPADRPSEQPALGLSAWGDGSTRHLPSPARVESLGCAPLPGGCFPAAGRRHGAITEWWAPVPGGVEQGWTVEQPPSPGAGTLHLEIHTGGLRPVHVDDDGRGATLAGTGDRSWRYDQLRAWDARGRDLPATLSADDDGLVVVVDVDDATWPVIVDPVLSINGNNKILPNDGFKSGVFGAAVAAAGDVDGDGFGDVIIGSPAGDARPSVSGLAYMYYGSRRGLDVAREHTLSGITTGNSPQFGAAVAGGGDINDDGYADVAVGAPYDDAGGRDAGGVWIFLGGPGGAGDGGFIELRPSTPVAYRRYGAALAFVGDLDLDGYDDLAVGAPNDSTDISAEGSVFIYYGSDAGPSREQRVSPSDNPSGANFGVSVAGGGDPDGDGYPDLIVGAWLADAPVSSSGAAYAYFGGPSGLDATREIKLTVEGPQSNDWFGRSVAMGGDIDGDGYDDVVVGCHGREGAADDAGIAFIIPGSPTTGLDGPRALRVVPTDRRAYDAFGYAVAVPGDVDADGYADMLISAPSDDEMGEEAGGAWLLYGVARRSGGPVPYKLTADDGGPYLRYGGAVAGAGDIDGDGFVDLLVGSENDDDLGRSSGSAWLYLGCLEGDADDDGACATADCDDADASVGNPIDLYPDADGDGSGADVAPSKACTGEAGFVTVAGDCDDSDATIHVGAIDIGGDGIDQDCDGVDAEADEVVPEPPDDGIDDLSSDCACTSPGRAPSLSPLLALLLLAGARRRR